MNVIRFSKLKAGLILLMFFMVASPSGNASDSTAAPKERAVAALEQDLKTDPNNSELWLHLGFAYRKMGNMDQAQAAFEKASSLNPREPDAFYMLGLIYESKHQTQAAEKAWKDYLAAETDSSKRAIAEKHIHHLSQ